MVRIDQTGKSVDRIWNYIDDYFTGKSNSVMIILNSGNNAKWFTQPN